MSPSLSHCSKRQKRFLIPLPTNSHAKSDQGSTEGVKDATILNGKVRSPSPVSAKDSQNRQAFAANNSLPEQTPSDSTTKQDATDDVEMGDVNGTSGANEKEPSPAAEVEKEVAKEIAGSSPKEASPEKMPVVVAEDEAKEEKAKDEAKDEANVEAKDEAKNEAKDQEAPKPESTPEPTTNDKMDIDASNESSDLTSSVEQAIGTQDTATTDPPVASSNDSTQLANESKLSPNAENGRPSEERATSPAKVPRMREDDNPDEPASKRTKIEDATTPVGDSLVVASGPSPAPQPSSKPSDEVPDDKPITPFQNKQLRGLLASLKKTKNGQHFRQSVERLWPTVWNDYKVKVQEPVDLTLFEARLREDKYATYGEFKAKVRLLYSNAASFNGPDHFITSSGGVVRDQIFSKLQEISKMEEPAKPEKGKIQPTRHAEPRSATQARRQSQTQVSQVAASPKPKAEAAPIVAPPASATSSAPAFAIPPNGVPQIRRDSTREDGDRPKRPIHPPKNRDLDYGSKGNRKKKLDPEQRFHDEVLNEVKKGKYFHMNQWFMEPVDPVALNIPTYFSIVKKPMDLATMTRKNLEGHYKSSKDVEKDMRLIVHNAELFNGTEHDVSKLGHDLEEFFKAELGKKDQWMAQHYPQDEPSATNASAVSPERSLHESEDESEVEEAEDTNEAIRNLQGRLNEEQDKLNTLLGSKKPDLTMIEIQQSMVSMLQRKIVEERTKFHSGAKKPKAKKKSAKSKPRPSTSAATASTSKKSSSGHAATTKKSSGGGSKKAAPKKRSIGQLEKAVIEEGIGNLDGTTLTKAVDIIKKDTGQNVSYRIPVFRP